MTDIARAASNRSTVTTQDCLEHASHATPWRVLLVDDEPGVHEISRLVLADLSFAGRSVELLSAHSAAEARARIEQARDIALVLLDVVMETDDAGLALVRHIREQLRDDAVQIVLRTGQPGMAPERDVVLRYAINGYFLKTEITAQKLHSIVVSSLRAFQTVRSLRRSVVQQGADVAATRGDPRHERLIAQAAAATPEDDLVLLAQPEVALGSLEAVGVELLPQWRTSEGMLGVTRIVEMAADAAQLQRAMALRLVRLACAWSNSWRAARGTVLRVSVPLIAAALDDGGLLGEVHEAVSESGLAPGMLDLQIPETCLQWDRPLPCEAVRALQMLGVSITLIDFGSGLISLPMLYRLEPDRLKIHRAFVRGAAGDTERAAMARSVIALAHTLGIVAIADGIASDADLQFFKWEGCDIGEGDMLNPPMALHQVANFLATGRVSTH